MKNAVLALLLVALSSAAWAQSFPSRAVRFIVPSSPGGGIDSTARVVTTKLTELWGQPAVVENRPGGSMIIGAEAAAKSSPDGYTVLVAHDGTMSMNPVVFPKLPYDPQRDFTPLSLMTSAPLMLAVHPSIGVGSVKELIAHARANPGKLNHSTGGTATLLALELNGEPFDYPGRSEIENVPNANPVWLLPHVVGQHQHDVGPLLGHGGAPPRGGRGPR